MRTEAKDTSRLKKLSTRGRQSLGKQIYDLMERGGLTVISAAAYESLQEGLRKRDALLGRWLDRYAPEIGGERSIGVPDQGVRDLALDTVRVCEPVPETEEQGRPGELDDETYERHAETHRPFALDAVEEMQRRGWRGPNNDPEGNDLSEGADVIQDAITDALHFGTPAEVPAEAR